MPKYRKISKENRTKEAGKNSLDRKKIAQISDKKKEIIPNNYETIL